MKGFLRGVDKAEHVDLCYEFERLVESTHLTPERAKDLSKETPIIGHVNKEDRDYSATLSLERLLRPVDDFDVPCLWVGQLNDSYSVIIGGKPDGLDILQGQHIVHYRDIQYLDTGEKYYVEVPRSFRVDVCNLLESVHMRKKFSVLMESDTPYTDRHFWHA